MLDATALDGPDVADRANTAFRMPRIQLYLVGACDSPADREAWLFAAADGRAVSNVLEANLFAFSMAGYQAAWAAASALIQGPLSGCRAITARVVVTGDKWNPDETIEAWRLEGDRPVRLVRYSFE